MAKDDHVVKEFLTPKEVAKILGRSYVTIYRWIKADKIPSVQLTGKKGGLLIPVSWVDEVRYIGGASDA